MNYKEFIESKKKQLKPTGIDIDVTEINPMLFDFQKELVQLALKKGRFALFVDTGLGKTFMQLEYARILHKKQDVRTLILAPLAVSYQTVREGKKLDIDVNHCRSQKDVKNGINITNYDMLEHFEADKFDCIILDESGILKNYSGKIRTQITEMFLKTRYKLCCSATPAPNDYTELLTHAEFLNVMERKTALATYFVHDSGKTSDWRLKGHAVKEFNEWVNLWGIFIKKPSDLGYSDEMFDLPKLNKKVITVKTDMQDDEQLFRSPVLSATNYNREKKHSLSDKINEIKKIVNEEQFIIWVETNIESTTIAKAIPGAVEVKGSDKREFKEQSIMDFIDGKIRVLVTKPKMFGFGLNLQNCYNVIYCSLSFSFESYYQSLRRVWRFGQKNEVNVWILLSYNEYQILKNIQNKELLFNELGA